MTRMTSGLAVLTATMLLAPLSVDGQMGQRERRGPADGIRGQGVEAIMRLRERLELDEGQLQQLDQIRQEAVQRRVAHQAEMEELRSKMLAGDLEADAFREAMAARREAAEAVRSEQQERIDAVLSDAQRGELQNLRDQGRAFMRGRASAMRGRREGAWDGRGFRSGASGPEAWGGRRGARRGSMRAPMRRGRGGPGPGFGPPA